MKLLRIKSGFRQDEEILLQKPQMVIGSQSDADIRFQDAALSRRHCTIVLEGETPWIVDLDSTGGTFVNGARITKIQLNAGDRIQVGETELEYMDSNAPVHTQILPAVKPVDATQTIASSGKQDNGNEKVLAYLTDQSGKQIPINKEYFTIGRKPDNDLVLEFPEVSGNHAVIHFENGIWFCSDKNSTNGTYINSEKITKQSLENKDQLQFDTYSFKFIDENRNENKNENIEKTQVESTIPDSKRFTMNRTMIIGIAALAALVIGIIIMVVLLLFPPPSEPGPIIQTTSTHTTHEITATSDTIPLVIESLQLELKWEAFLTKSHNQAPMVELATSTPAIGFYKDKKAFIAVADNLGNLHIFDGATGEQTKSPNLIDCSWRQKGRCGESSPAVYDMNKDGTDDIIIAMGTKLFVFSLVGKPLLLSTNDDYIKNTISSSPIVADINNDNQMDILLATNDGFIFAMDMSGSELWKQSEKPEGNTKIYPTPILANITEDGIPDLIVLDNIHHVFALDPAKNGSLIESWNFDYSEYTSGKKNSPALLYYGDPEPKPYVTAIFGQHIYLHPLELDTNQPIIFPLDTEVSNIASLVAANIHPDSPSDELIAVVQRDVDTTTHHYIESYRLDLNKPIKRDRIYETNASITSSPALADLNNDTIPDIIVTTTKGTVLLINGATFDRFEGGEFSVSDETIASSPVIGDVDMDGILDIVYVTEKGMLTCLSFKGLEENIHQKNLTPWLMFRGSIHRTGRWDK